MNQPSITEIKEDVMLLAYKYLPFDMRNMSEVNKACIEIEKILSNINSSEKEKVSK